MIAKDEEALICDLAETYHILDYKAVPVKTLAILANGLRDDSRIKMKLANVKASLQEMLLASVVDNLSFILKGLSGNKEKPFLFTELLTEKTGSGKGFHSPEAFEEARKKILLEGEVR